MEGATGAAASRSSARGPGSPSARRVSGPARRETSFAAVPGASFGMGSRPVLAAYPQATTLSKRHARSTNPP